MAIGRSHAQKTDHGIATKSGAFFVLISEKRDHPSGPVGLCVKCCSYWVTDDRWLKEIKVNYEESRWFCYECGEHFELSNL